MQNTYKKWLDREGRETFGAFFFFKKSALFP